jgi:hypothetical protein
MAFENEAQAAEALAAAVNAPEGTDPAQVGLTAESVQTQQQPNQFEAPNAEPRVETGDQGYQQAVEAPQFTPSKDIDLSGLSDEQRQYLDAREKEMQAHFTRTMQEVSAERQQAAEAIQFINELNTNPNFASEVVQTLSNQLQAAGYSVAQADAHALAQTQQMASGQPQVAQPSQSDFSFGDDEGFQDDPYLAEINQLRARQEQVDQYLGQMQEAQRVAQLEAQLNNQAAYVQTQNPDFTDTDMSRVVNMSYAYGGNLVRAAEEYRAIRDQAVAGWIEQKGSVTTPAPVPAGTTAVSAPEPFKGLDDPRLEQAAQARLAAVLGNS